MSKCDICGEEMEFSKMYMCCKDGDIKNAKSGHKGCILKIVTKPTKSKEVDYSGWIPVSERLPDKVGHYLVTSELNYYHGGCWDITDDGTSHSIAIAFYDRTDKIGGRNYWNHSHVIAWMPLPKKYIKEVIK